MTEKVISISNHVVGSRKHNDHKPNQIYGQVLIENKALSKYIGKGVMVIVFEP